jgi:site-specific recombinase XerD
MNSSAARVDGNCPIVLRVIAHRVKKELNLNLKWPKLYFDENQQRCLPRFSGDISDCETINLLIEDAKGRANKITLRYYSNDRPLTAETFISEYYNYHSRDNILKFWDNKAIQLSRDQIISYETFRRHKTSLNRLRLFTKPDELLFTELTLEFIQKYDHYLRKKEKYKHNTVCGFHKDLKTYINHAIEAGHRIESPYLRFSYSYRPGERAVLSMEELTALKNLVDTDKVTDTENEVLKSFLFSCYTGLRVSDNRALHSDMISNGLLTVTMKKGFKFGKQVVVPLPEYAKQLIEGRKGKIFNVFAEKTRNDTLKILAAKARINKSISFHVSRDTFGTIFIELGGDPVTLKELMGHTNIAVTMIYVKISERRKETLMANFDKIA